MSALVDKLHRDHINQYRLLNLLEYELQKLEKGGNPSYLNMYDIMIYMINFPEVFHHPYEEILFEKLGDVDMTATKTIERLSGEHETLSILATNLESLLHMAASGSVVSKDELASQARTYLELLRQHMEVEEREVFPLINEEMTLDDWERLEPALKLVEDPIFSGAIADEFRRLYDSIVSRGF